jgi:glycosyltransferase involved in cell wall biosynthesis
VTFEPGVPAGEVGPLLQDCDALLVPLGAHPLLADFIPSKLYDAMAVGRAAIVGVAADGEAARLVRESGCGIVIAPEDGAALAGAVRDLAADRSRAAALGADGRAAVGEHARSRQVERLEAVLRSALRTA